MAKRHFRLLTLLRHLEGDLGTRPLVRIFGEIEIGAEHAPGDPLVRDELGDPLLAEVDVLVAIREFCIEFVGRPFDLS
jgi:hypothetical protein